MTEETTDWAAHLTAELLLGQGGCFPTLPRLPVILASAVSSAKFCKATLLPLKHAWWLIQTDMIRSLLVWLRGWWFSPSEKGTCKKKAHARIVCWSSGQNRDPCTMVFHKRARSVPSAA